MNSPLRKKILFALTPKFREDFLPFLHETPLAREAGVEFLEKDPSPLSNPEWSRLLHEINPSILVTGWGTRAVPEDFSGDYICHITGSVRSIVPRGLLERGVRVSNWGTRISYTIAEQAMLLVLGTLRGAPLWPSFIARDWGSGKDPKTGMHTRSLRGKRVGIHGFGAIVRELIPMLRAFQTEISVYSRNVPNILIENSGAKALSSLEELFSGSDILIECEALTPENAGSINVKILSLLPEGSVFVNVGRAGLVDEEALLRLAAEKKWRLGLDVFSREPFPSDSPLRTMPGAFLSPHIGGPTADAFVLCGDHALENIGHFLRGLPLEGEVTLEIYDRST